VLIGLLLATCLGLAGNIIASQLEPMFLGQPVVLWSIFIVLLVASGLYSYLEYKDKSKTKSKHENIESIQVHSSANDFDNKDMGNSSNSRANYLYQNNDVFVEQKSDRIINGKITFIPPRTAGYGGYLFGRRAIFEQVNRALETRESSPIILYGMGGIGKSALAAGLAWGNLSMFPGGVIWIDHSLDNIYDLCNEIIRLFNENPTHLQNLSQKTAQVRKLLNRERTLVVLDNCTNRDVVQTFAENCTPTSLIVTARQKLAIAGKFINVEQLDIVAAKELFMHAAQIIDGRHKKEINLIVNILNGHPQAITVAAATCWEEHITPSELLELLDPIDQRIQALQLGKDVKNSVWATFLVSYDQMSSDEQFLFRSFAGLWDKTVTKELVGLFLRSYNLDHIILPRNLVKRSLLIDYEHETKGISLFRIHDLLYSFAHGLITEKQDNLRAMKLDWNEALLTYCTKYSSSKFTNLDALEVELENILGSIEWSAQQGRWEHVDQLASMVLESKLVELRGFATDAERLFTNGIMAAKHLAKPENEGKYSSALAIAYAYSGQYQSAQTIAKSGLDIAIETKNLLQQQTCFDILGNIYRILGDSVQAQKYHNKASKIAEELNDWRSQGIYIGNIGLDYYHLGKQRLAIKNFEEALEIARNHGDKLHEGRHLSRMADAYTDWEKPEVAIGYLRQAIGIAKELGNIVGEMFDRGGLAKSYLALGELITAKHEAQSALNISHMIGHLEGQGYWLATLSIINTRSGKLHLGRSLAYEAIEVSDRIEHVRGKAYGHLALAENLLELGDYKEALKVTETALSISKITQQLSFQADALKLLSKINQKLRVSDEKILNLLKLELSIREELGHKKRAKQLQKHILE